MNVDHHPPDPRTLSPSGSCHRLSLPHRTRGVASRLTPDYTARRICARTPDSDGAAERARTSYDMKHTHPARGPLPTAVGVIFPLGNSHCVQDFLAPGGNAVLMMMASEGRMVVSMGTPRSTDTSARPAGSRAAVQAASAAGRSRLRPLRQPRRGRRSCRGVRQVSSNCDPEMTLPPSRSQTQCSPQ